MSVWRVEQYILIIGDATEQSPFGAAVSTIVPAKTYNERL